VSGLILRLARHAAQRRRLTGLEIERGSLAYRTSGPAPFARVGQARLPARRIAANIAKLRGARRADGCARGSRDHTHAPFAIYLKQARKTRHGAHPTGVKTQCSWTPASRRHGGHCNSSSAHPSDPTIILQSLIERRSRNSSPACNGLAWPWSASA
jgi:hypothetical protein